MNQATVLKLPKRLNIDDQVLTQLNNRCLFAIKFSRSVEFAASQIYLHNSVATRLNARPVYTRQSLKQTMQYKLLLCRTSYATAPRMQTPAPAAMPHLLCKHPHQLLCRTCYAKPLLLMQTTSSNFPPTSRFFQIRPPKCSNPDAKFIEI